MKPIHPLILMIALCLIVLDAGAQLINKKLAAELSAIYRKDQQFRSAAIVAVRKYGAYSPQDNALMQRQDIADQANLVKIEKIIAAHGYPGKSLVGDQSKVAFMVIQHNDLDAQEKYLPLFIEAAAKSELDPSLVPLMVDRVRTGKGQAQLYGTQLYEKKGGSTQVFPIEDEINVDVRRKAAGMPPLKEYLKNWNIDYHLPTAAGNPNPSEIYADQNERRQSPVEAIGGDAGILSRLRYPEKARASRITGFVTVGYTVNTQGKTKNIEVVKGLGYGCDEEAIRVIREARYNNPSGEDAEMRMKLPFPFKGK